MHARNGFRRIKHGRVRRDSVRSESRLRRLRDWLLRQRMRQRFKRSVVLEPEMRSFVPFDQGEDRRRVITSEVARCVTRCGLVQREPMRIRESRSMSMPRAKRRQVVAFSSHFGCPREKRGAALPFMRAS